MNIMNKKNLVSSLAGVMLFAGLLGAGANMQNVHAATTQNQGTSISIKRRSVNVTVNSDKPQLIAYDPSTGKFVKTIDSTYTKGQNLPVYFTISATETVNGQAQNLNFYFVNNQTIDGKDCMIFIQSTDVTTATAVPSFAEYQKTAQSDAKAIQDAYKNRTIKSFKVTPKSKKGSEIYYAYRESEKSKKIIFKASKKSIKYGKKYKALSVGKFGKTRYVYIGKKRYLKLNSVKMTDIKLSALNLPADIKNLIVHN